METYLEQQINKYQSLPYEPNIAIFMMGIPGSGKSTSCRNFIENALGLILSSSYIINQQYDYTLDNFILCNPDEVVKSHPDYTPDNSINNLHLSSKLNNKLLKTILNEEKTYNFIYDATGKQYGNYLKKIRQAQDRHYYTILVDVRTDVLTCYQRVIFRDRHVALNVISKIEEDIYTPKHYPNKYNHQYEGLNNYDILSDMVDLSLVIDNNNEIGFIKEIYSQEDNIEEELSDFININI